MKSLKTILCVLVMFLVMPSWGLLMAERVSKIVFYVSPEGSDSHTGTSVDKPFATLQKARDAIRTLKQEAGLKSPVTVFLLGGTYELTEPFILTTEDSGSEICPITYSAYKDEKPIISGGREIKGQWEKYEGNIMVWDVPEARDGKWKFRQLFLNGKRMDRARIPDKDNYFIVEKTDQDIGRSAMKFKEGDIKIWNNLDEAEIVIFHAWNDSRLFISNVDEQERIVTFTGPIGRALRNSNSSIANRYYIENVLEGLDHPGEWYLDSHTGRLYLYPIEDLSKSELRAPIVNQLVVLQGNLVGREYVQYINFSGLTFSDVDYVLPKEGIPTIRDVGDIYKPSAISFEGTKFCTFKDNCIRNVGTYAIEVTGDGNRISSNQIYDTGGGGIISRSYGKEPNILTYNHIHDCGTVFYSAVGINVDDGGGEIVHNLVHDISQSGIYGRHWSTETQEQERRNQSQILRIEYNEIFRVMQKLNDGGGIFIRDSNIVIKNNLIHDVFSPAGYGSPGWGIYLGCETRYALVENNIVYRTTEGIHVWHASRHNTIVNNIFVDSQNAVIKSNNPRNRHHENIRFMRNIFYFTGSDVFTYLTDGEHSLLAESDYNIFWNPRECFHQMQVIRGLEGTENFADWQGLGFDTHSLVMDPGFVNASDDDFSLKPNSPAFKIGFKSIDISNVGLRGKTKK
jgi:parallel beta-helix repeat protein